MSALPYLLTWMEAVRFADGSTQWRPRSQPMNLTAEQLHDADPAQMASTLSGQPVASATLTPGWGE